jgi:hypothetical protein
VVVSDCLFEYRNFEEFLYFRTIETAGEAEVSSAGEQLAQKPEGLFISQVVVREAESGTKGEQSATVPTKGNTFYLRLTVSKDAVCTFEYSTDGTRFRAIGEPFTARKGKWIGAKVGLFAIGPGKNGELGYVDIDWFRVG